MSSTRRAIQILSVLLLLLFFSACFSVYVVKDVRNPRFHLKRAEREIEKLHLRYPKRGRRAHSIHILVYERDSGHLVKVSAPLWFVNACLDFGLGVARRHADFDFEDRYEVDWRSIRDLGQVGPGLLVEVLHDEDRVLIWLK